jgi:hypothetical protein
VSEEAVPHTAAEAGIPAVETGSRPPHPGAVLSLLASSDRLRCLSAVVLGAGSETEVVRATGLAERAAQRALGRLVGGGLVGRDQAGRLVVRDDVVARAARTAGGMRVAVTPEDVGAGPGQVEVLRRFLVDGRLRSIPVQRGKRLVVLDFLAQRFEPGRVYPEREVNAVLGRFHPDYAALRRYLVDEDFLERREGFYWRVGGTFETG